MFDKTQNNKTDKEIGRDLGEPKNYASKGEIS
jgi:hypothetical protein